MHFVFVYGTLKQGEPNHYLLENDANGVRIFRGKAKTVNKFPLVVASRYNIPFVLDCAGTGLNIQGEIYEVDDDMLGHLDKLEQHPNYYTRTAQEFEIISSSNVEDIKVGDVIKGGIYLLKNFKEDLLKLPFLETYEDQGYVKPWERSSKDPWIGDVKKSLDKN